MILHATELRAKLFHVFKLVDQGEEVTIVKKDSNKKYRIIPLDEGSKPDIAKVAQEMGEIKLGLGSLSPRQLKKILETKYD